MAWHCITEQSQYIPLKIPHICPTYFSHRQQARNRDGVGRWELRVRIILLCRLASGVLSNIDHQQKKTEYRPNIDHTALYRPNIDHKSSLKSAYLHVLRHNPTSQEIHVKQGAGRYFHISSFNGRVIHFQVLRFIIFQIIGKIYHHSERF